MSALGVAPVTVAADAEVEPLLRWARAGVARRALELRATRYEIDRLDESDRGRDDRAAELAACLNEALDQRRRELRVELDTARCLAAESVAAARAMAARDEAASEAASLPSVAPPSVAALAVPAAIGGGGAMGLAQPSDQVVTEVLEGEADDLQATAGDPSDETSSNERPLAGDEPVPEVPTVEEAGPDQSADGIEVVRARTASGTPSMGTAVPAAPPADDLARLVQLAVTTGIAELLKAAAMAPERGAATETMLIRPPVRRRLLHVDVVLPLVLVVIVLVVLLAWV